MKVHGYSFTLASKKTPKSETSREVNLLQVWNINLVIVATLKILTGGNEIAVAISKLIFRLFKKLLYINDFCTLALPLMGFANQ